MLSRYICVGILRNEPRRLYTKVSKKEVSHFALLVRRNENRNKFDYFYFEAYCHVAKYVNDYFHTGDIISVVARPKNIEYTKKNGTKVDTVKFIVDSVDFVCHNKKLEINNIDSLDLENFMDTRYLGI